MIDKITIDLKLLEELSKKPAYGATGEALWTDPYIARQLLDAHLADGEGASRPSEMIAKTTTWLGERLELDQGKRLLDLGCGPGLYARRFADSGVNVTGIDFSANSISYAQKKAREEGQEINYIQGNYLEMDYGKGYDVAVLIYYDLGVLFPQERDNVLARVHGALNPGGYFAFDVLGPNHRGNSPKVDWDVSVGPGFYRPDSHLALSNSYHYPEQNAWVDQHVVWDDKGGKVIRVWEHYYTPESISAILTKAGFCVEEIREDLAGEYFNAQSTTLAIIARKK